MAAAGAIGQSRRGVAPGVGGPGSCDVFGARVASSAIFSFWWRPTTRPDALAGVNPSISSWHFCGIAAGAFLGAVVTALPAQNLAPNPGFESGNVGFSSDYGYSAGANCCEGQYTVRANGSSFNGAFVNPPPASAGSSQFMVVNGSTVPNQRVWFASVPVVAGVTYRFELAGCTAVAGGPAILQWQVGGQLVGAPLPLPHLTGIWQTSGATWVAGATGSVEVAIRNLNTSAFPNDFYIDDLYIGPCQSCWRNYGAGLPGAQGIPNLVPSSPPQLGTTIDLRATTVRSTQEFGVVALGLAAATLPTPVGGTLLVDPLATVALFVPPTPAATLVPIALPNDPTFTGISIYGQFAHTDPTAVAGFAFSRGLELTVGP